MTDNEPTTTSNRPSAEAIAKASRVLAQAYATCALMTPREQAEAAYTPTGPGVDELEDRIRADRGLPPLERKEANESK